MSNKNWNVVGERKSDHPVEIALELGSFGLYKSSNVYTVENTKSEEIRHVSAINREHLGRKISEGELED